MQKHKDKKIWLIGASTGIGEALARRLAADGANLALSARDAEKLGTLLNNLPGRGHISLPLDVTDAASVSEGWAKLKDWAHIDIVIYNAGAYDPMDAAQFELTKAEQMVAVNFSGALRVLSHVIPSFVAGKGGHVVLVASAAAYSGLPKAIGYGASKAALLHLAENLRIDLGKCGVKVQVVNPGFVKTRLTDKNSFAMPFLVTPEFAAARIAEGMEKERFEIHFPRRFTLMLKFLRLLPYGLYFRVAKRI